MQTSSSERARAIRLALATFAILALELSLIRWMSQQVRIFAYLNNIILMASFLGMGLGIAVGRRRPWLIHLALPLTALALAIYGVAFVVLAAEPHQRLKNVERQLL